MLRILDRYLLREIATPFLLSLLMLTFALQISPIIEHGERLIAKGASWGVVSRVLLTLLPQALGITIPMAVLIGLLIALGRLAGDREIVALEACGVSIGRLLRPLLLFGLLTTGATAYVMIVALPDANQAFREIMFRVLMSHAESEVRPRVFYTTFPNLVLYANEVTPGVGWTDVLVADTSKPGETTLYLADRGRLLLDEPKRKVEMVLEQGSTHTVKLSQPDRYDFGGFQQTHLTINPESIFPRKGPVKGDREMTIADLKAEMAESYRQNLFPHNQIMEWQKKYSFPVSCLAFLLVALGLGVSNRRDGRLASFVLGIAIVLIYYIIYTAAEAVAKAGTLGNWFAWAAMWVPDIVIALWGAALLARRMRAPERPIQLPMPSFRRRPHVDMSSIAGRSSGPRPGRVVVVIKIPKFTLPSLSILDWYVMRQALRVTVLAVAGLLALFYIASFFDLSQHLLKGRTSLGMILRFLWFATPQYIYYGVPLAVLIGALVTIGSLTKNTELVVMKACGISLYRVAAPLLLLAILGSAVLLALEEGILAASNRRAHAINDAIRGRLPTTTTLNRRWVAAANGNIYQYVHFDSSRNELNGLEIYEFGKDRSTLARRTYLSRAQFPGSREAKGRVMWQGTAGWQREFEPKSRFVSFQNYAVSLEGPGYFSTERPNEEQMSYSQLREHVTALQAGGYDVVPYVVALHRKIAFPFVTLIMALIAVPFAVTTGKRGAMYGIGAGIVLAILYWTAISIFGAVGASGMMVPALAAWAPNILFGCVAAYLLLTVRT
jgi:LPS export ABC transporter permease LptG/LPS export ABC transporter permease LptF